MLDNRGESKAEEWILNCELKLPWPDFMYYPGCWLEGLKTSTKTLGLDSRP